MSHRRCAVLTAASVLYTFIKVLQLDLPGFVGQSSAGQPQDVVHGAYVISFVVCGRERDCMHESLR
jgi:hypothetical protein